MEQKIKSIIVKPEPAEVTTEKPKAAVTAEIIARAASILAALPAEFSAPTSVRIVADAGGVQTDIGDVGWRLTLTVSR